MTAPAAWAQGKSAKSGKAIASAKSTGPTTVADARKAIDLTTLPLYKGAKDPDPANRKWSKVRYDVEAPEKELYAFHRQQLLERKWTEVDAETAATLGVGDFKRDGYLVTLSVITIQKGTPTVAIQNKGNVDLVKLPLPPGAKPFIDSSSSAVYHIGTPAPATSKAVAKVLKDKGWQAYGADDVAMSFKQNAMKLDVMVSAPDEPGGKTTIAYSAELMAVDLPPMLDATDLEYSDRTDTLEFNTKAKPAAIADFYTKTLTKTGWTTDMKSLTKVDDVDTLVFKNAEKETLTLEVTMDEGKTHAKFKYQPATSVANAEAEKAEKAK